MILDRPSPLPGLRLSYGDKPSQFGDLRLPPGAGSHPVVVVIHGGFWRARYDLEHIGHLCAALARNGFATWSLEYRRLGNPGGGWPGTFQDIARGTAYLQILARSYPLNLQHVIVMGHSAGGHLALWLAALPALLERPEFSGMQPVNLWRVIALAGVSDLRRAWELGLSGSVVADLLGGGPDEHPELYAAASPVELLPLHTPQILLHGDLDEEVPLEMSQRYIQKAQAAGDPAQLITLPGTGHFELIDPATLIFQYVLQAVKGP